MKIIEKVLGYFTTSKMYVEVVVEKITAKAKSSGQTFKQYVHNDDNISHISLVVYDCLPLAFKLGLRYDTFNKAFIKNFSVIRSKLFTQPVAQKPDSVSVGKKPSEKVVTRKVTPAKKASQQKSAIEPSEGQYIFRPKKDRTPSVLSAKRLINKSEAKVLKTVGDVLLVNVSSENVKQLAKSLPDWTYSVNKKVTKAI